MDSQNKDDQEAKSTERVENSQSSGSSGQRVPRSELDQLRYPSRDGTILSQLYNQPITTTLTSFSHVANFVRNPYELINNVEEYVRHASRQQHQQPQRTSENFARTLNQNRHSSTPTSPSVQEMDTFVAGPQDVSASSGADDNHEQVPQLNGPPNPCLPKIEASTKRGRLEPLTIEEYERIRQTATDLELIERVFYGSMSCNQLRAALWPYLFGIIIHRGKFEKISDGQGNEAYIFVEHEANNRRWIELQRLYDKYEAQWMAILPDQETRFSTFRERKSLIERDVIRCDRLHPFYAESRENLDKLTNLLMTYMMYDFDIGYVQGMSDLAGPILYMYQGDLVKSFWILVEVMKLFRRNFELTQKTIHFQLACLHELIKNTDPIFAQYLDENESSNCYFAFRAIVCQFKRELMKEDEDEYGKVLFLWDTIWSVKRRAVLQEELKTIMSDEMQTDPSEGDVAAADQGSDQKKTPIINQPTVSQESPFAMQLDPDQADSLRYQLTETEIFVLALCLSMIRRNRDLIMANKLDGTDIHLHFIDPKLAHELNDFIEHAINIHSYLKNDFDIRKLTSPEEVRREKEVESNSDSPPGSAEGYDLLNDFLVITGASGT